MRSKSIDCNKIAMVLNYLIFIIVVCGLIVVFTGYKFTFIPEPALKAMKLGALRFFTVQCNLLMGITALIMAHKERKVANGSNKDIAIGFYILKLVATVSVSLTFLVVFMYLARIVDGGLISLLQNSNIFFHLIVPLLSIITFLFFEKTDKIKFNYNICSLIPVLLYGIYYVINIIVHLDNGVVSPKYDWYCFMQTGINNAYLAATIIVVMTFVISVLLWITNRKRKI